MAQPPAADRRVWLACAPALSRLQEVGDEVYYLPAGHAAQCHGALPGHLLDRVLCEIAGVALHATPFDDVYACVTLRPKQGRALVAGSDEADGELERDLSPTGADPQRKDPAVAAGRYKDYEKERGKSARGADPERDDDEPVLLRIYPKVLTRDEAAKPGGKDGWKRVGTGAFHVPKACARNIFPMLDPALSGPQQSLRMVDLAGRVFSFGHTLSGGLGGRRHDLVTSGWSDYVAAKQVSAKDLVLFIRAPGRLVIAAQRAAPPAALVAMEEVEAACHLAAEGRDFSVTWCPRLGAEFVIPRAEFETSAHFNWAPGMRVSARTGTVRAGGVVHPDSLHVLKLVNGTIKSVRDCPWHKLEVEWDTDTDRREDRPGSSMGHYRPSSSSSTAASSPTKGHEDWPSSSLTSAASGSQEHDGPSSSAPRASAAARASRTAPIRLFGATISR